jgi:hypothetical protein
MNLRLVNYISIWLLISKGNIMKKEEIILKVCQVIPYPEQIKFVDAEDDCFRFEWRGNVFRVDSDLNTEEIQGSMLVGSNTAILLQKLLKPY